MTRRFTFRLQPVLQHRERVEDEAQQALAVRHVELVAAQDVLLALDAEFRNHAEALRGDHRRFDTEQLRLHYAHLEYLDRSIAAQRQTVARCQAACERARLDVMDASKDRKVIEKLKEHRREQHDALASLVEQRDLDDANARRYVRAMHASERSP